MNIIGLNSNFVAIGNYSNFIELGWNRKYYECGDFSLYMRAEDYDENIKYLKVADDQGTRPETGIIQKIEFEEKIDGDFITLSGFFLENWLNNYCIPAYADYGIYGTNANYQASIGGIINRYSYDYLNPDTTYRVNFVQQANKFPKDNVPCIFEKGTYLGDCYYTILQNQEMGMIMSFNTSNNRYTLTFTLGDDKTNSIIFSIQLGNVSDMKYTYDDSNKKTFCTGYTDITQYESNHATMPDPDYNSDGKSYYYNSYGVAGLGVKNISISDISYDSLTPPDETTGTDAEWKTFGETIKNEIIPKACQLKLLDYLDQNNVEATVQQNVNYYPVDYDLGDKVTINVDKMGVQYQARIIEVAEVWKENHQEFTLTFGNKVRQKKNI